MAGSPVWVLYNNPLINTCDMTIVFNGLYIVLHTLQSTSHSDNSPFINNCDITIISAVGVLCKVVFVLFVSPTTAI